MKIIKKLLLGLLVFIFMFTSKIIAQDEVKKEEFKPVYLAIATGHWSSDSDVDFSDWLETEKEYFEKVTMKNDLIIGSGYYIHYFTPDNSEILFASVYKNWEDMEKANDVTTKLIEEGWQNKEERDAFFKKQSSYYSPMHSDEIYTSLSFTKPLKTDSKEPLLFYVKKNILGEGGAGFKEYFENVTMKNSFIKGYYSHRHSWGSNSRDAIEVFVFDNFTDIEKSFKENIKLSDEHWPDEAKRKEFFKEYGKIFAGHGDYIYHNVPELAK
tara:strand:- start:513 stop:1319 length:807 start_codon:yes stop_codon:yes gene_type:complete